MNHRYFGFERPSPLPQVPRPAPEPASCSLEVIPPPVAVEERPPQPPTTRLEPSPSPARTVPARSSTSLRRNSTFAKSLGFAACAATILAAIAMLSGVLHPPGESEPEIAAVPTAYQASPAMLETDPVVPTVATTPLPIAAEEEFERPLNSAGDSPGPLAVLETIAEPETPLPAPVTDRPDVDAVAMAVGLIAEPAPLVSTDQPSEPDDAMPSVTESSDLQVSAETPSTVAPAEAPVAKATCRTEPSSLDFVSASLPSVPQAKPACASATACASEPGGLDRSFGTTIQWADTPAQASELARAQGKMVLLLQVSGNFARDEFT